jgi:hypothetical protein
MSGISNALGMGAIMNLFDDTGRDGSRSPKFPKELLTVLGTKLQNIAMGRDAAWVVSRVISQFRLIWDRAYSYNDQLLRGTVAIFWGSLQDPAFSRNMKEDRKIETLILHFVSTSHGALKKNKTLAEGDAWKVELNNQIAFFIRILRESLRLCSHVPPELTTKLDGYTERLVPTASDTASDSGYGSSSGTASSSPIVFASIPEMSMVQSVAKLFGHKNQDIQTDLGTLRKTCTAKVSPYLYSWTDLLTLLTQAALLDLKVRAFSCWILTSTHRARTQDMSQKHHYGCPVSGSKRRFR